MRRRSPAWFSGRTKRDAASDTGASQQYKDAYAVLKQGDHYVLMMIERGLKRYLRPWWRFF
jgi:hypothetical protein